MKWMLLVPVLLAAQDDPAAFEKRMGTVEARPADAAPKIDGVADDKAWASAKEHTLAVDIPEEILEPKQSATLKVLHHGGEIFFLLRWKDKTESIHHKPWVWNADRKQYVASEELEDVAFIAFQLEGKFNMNMRAGVVSVWDVWHWKAARTNPIGYATDKTHRYTLKKPAGKSKFVKLVGDGFGYIQRPEDAGKSVTTTLDKPGSKQGDKVPHYKPQVPDGSAADVRAKGRWKDGWWTVEWKRKLNTGHKDDTEFKLGSKIGFAVGFARQAEDEDHVISMPYTLHLVK